MARWRGGITAGEIYLTDYWPLDGNLSQCMSGECDGLHSYPNPLALYCNASATPAVSPAERWTEAMASAPARPALSAAEGSAIVRLSFSH